MLMRNRRCDVPGSNPLASARVARRASSARLISGCILPRYRGWRQNLVGPDEEIVLACIPQTRQGVAGSRLAEREAISGATDGARLIDQPRRPSAG